MLIGCVGDVVFGEVVDEGKRAIVDGLVDHAHVISVENTMNKPVDLPVSHQFCSLFHYDLIHLFVGVALILTDVRVTIFEQIVKQGE
jgi:hypothetical protein